MPLAVTNVTNGKYYPTFELGFLGDFEDLENVSEMVAETSEASKVLRVKTTRARARVAKSAASENNTCTCTCAYTCRISNLISAEKANMSCYVIKAMDNV